jgi:hypothetical protein
LLLAHIASHVAESWSLFSRFTPNEICLLGFYAVFVVLLPPFSSSLCDVEVSPIQPTQQHQQQKNPTALPDRSAVTAHIRVVCDRDDVVMSLICSSDASASAQESFAPPQKCPMTSEILYQFRVMYDDG